MTQVRSTRMWLGLALAAAVAWGVVPGAQVQLLLREKEAPPDGVWVDSLDLTGVALRAAAAPASPPPRRRLPPTRSAASRTLTPCRCSPTATS
jgi:hypothetical protein